MKNQSHQIVAALLESREDELKDMALGMPKYDRKAELRRYFDQNGQEHEVVSDQDAHIHYRFMVEWADPEEPFSATDPYIPVSWYVHDPDDPEVIEGNDPANGGFSVNVPLISDADVQAFLADLAELEKQVVQGRAETIPTLEAATQHMFAKIQRGWEAGPGGQPTGYAQA